MARQRQLKSDPLIFWSALGFIIAFVTATLAFGDRARKAYSEISGWLMENLTWMYIGGISAVFIFLIVVFVSRYGNLRLGDDDDEPDVRC
ncbi:BCCT family transporter [Corynebacterium glaucum]|nr:High-affinity choline transport protein [Corynebacterium glaucum]